MVNKLQRSLKFLLLKLLRINDSAHGIAIGFTIGSLVNFIPTFGTGPFLSPVCAKLFRGNPIAGLIGGVAFLWAFPLLFYFNFFVGGALLTIEIYDIGSIYSVFYAGREIIEAFLVGMVINILLFGLGLYVFTFVLVKKYRSDFLFFIYKKWKL